MKTTNELLFGEDEYDKDMFVSVWAAVGCGMPEMTMCAQPSLHPDHPRPTGDGRHSWISDQ